VCCRIVHNLSPLLRDAQRRQCLESVWIRAFTKLSALTNINTSGSTIGLDGAIHSPFTVLLRVRLVTQVRHPQLDRALRILHNQLIHPLNKEDTTSAMLKHPFDISRCNPCRALASCSLQVVVTNTSHHNRPNPSKQTTHAAKSFCMSRTPRSKHCTASSPSSNCPALQPSACTTTSHSAVHSQTHVHELAVSFVGLKSVRCCM
jgi:hypothetical protein